MLPLCKMITFIRCFLLVVISIIKCRNKVQQITPRNSSPSPTTNAATTSSQNCRLTTRPTISGSLSSMMSTTSRSSSKRIAICPKWTLSSRLQEQISPAGSTKRLNSHAPSSTRRARRSSISLRADTYIWS